MLKTVLATLLRQVADELEQGKFTCDDIEIMASISALSNFRTEPTLSKAQACDHLNISRSTFDAYVKSGILPKGRKTSGFKELSWRKEELDAAKQQYPAKFKIKFNYNFNQEL